MTNTVVGDEKPWHPVARLPEDWQAWLKTQGEAPFRASQVFRWIHRQGELSPAAMTKCCSGATKKPFT